MNFQGQSPFLYIWEYLVKENSVREFRHIYGPNGDWIQLFSRADGFVQTRLYHDVNNPNRFVTIDFWASKEARDRFRKDFAAEFAKLDARCESFTTEERFFGDFEA